MPSIPERALRPYWQTKDESIRLYQGHVINVLKRLPEESVQLVVTSPPYWALRSYLADGHDSKHQEIGSEPSPDCGTHGQAQCGGCFICTMVAVFRGVHRVLRDDGILYCNLGDTYASSSYSEKRTKEVTDVTHAGNYTSAYKDRMARNTGKNIKVTTGLPSGNLVGIPWRVALALQADGWVLRQDIIWAKGRSGDVEEVGPGCPMPQSVTNRYASGHEHIFMLTKRGSGYYFDHEASREVGTTPPQQIIDRVKASKASSNEHERGRQAGNQVVTSGRVLGYECKAEPYADGKRNRRDVWMINPKGYEGAHFACFPETLVEPCIFAGTSEHGCCSECSAPYERITEREKLTRERPNDFTKRTGEEGTGNSCGNTVAGVAVKTLGWQARCKCKEELAEIGYEPGIVPCVVLDPFIGSGTTAVVALAHGRHCIGIDLSEKYLTDNAIPRIQGALLNRPGLAHLAGYEAQEFDDGASL